MGAAVAINDDIHKPNIPGDNYENNGGFLLMVVVDNDPHSSVSSYQRQHTETMAAMVRILRFQCTAWLTDASFCVNLAAFM